MLALHTFSSQDELSHNDAAKREYDSEMVQQQEQEKQKEKEVEQEQQVLATHSDLQR